MEPLISAAKRNEVELYYVDAAHFVFGAFLGYLWSKVRVFIRAPSGRQRYNILGAYHAMTGAMVAVTNITYVNSSSVMELLGKLRLLHPGRSIKVVLDNATHQRCCAVRSQAILLDIKLVFLPSDSPNLNFIERYWKLVKKKCLYNRFYGDFVSFCSAVDKCLNNGNKVFAEEEETDHDCISREINRTKSLEGPRRIRGIANAARTEIP